MSMLHENLAVLGSVLFLLSAFQRDIPPRPRPSDREEAGYLGPVHKVSTETETLSRKLYRISGNGQKELIEDTTGQFGNGRFLTTEEEFDENGRLVAQASSEEEAEQGPFRKVYHYDANGRLSDEEHFNRDGSPAGKNHYVYDSAGNKSEELLYTASGVLLSKARYDGHQNVTDIESFGRTCARVTLLKIHIIRRNQRRVFCALYRPGAVGHPKRSGVLHNNSRLSTPITILDS